MGSSNASGVNNLIRVLSLPGQMMMWEDSAGPQNISRKMSLILGARRHLEWGHEKHVNDTIQNHPAQVVHFLLLIFMFAFSD